MKSVYTHIFIRISKQTQVFLLKIIITLFKIKITGVKSTVMHIFLNENLNYPYEFEKNKQVIKYDQE